MKHVSVNASSLYNTQRDLLLSGAAGISIIFLLYLNTKSFRIDSSALGNSFDSKI